MRFFRLILGAAAASAALYAQSLSITSNLTLPPGTVGSFYSLQLNASGGRPPYNWSKTGTLPPGLSLECDERRNSRDPNGGRAFYLHADRRRRQQYLGFRVGRHRHRVRNRQRGLDHHYRGRASGRQRGPEL